MKLSEAAVKQIEHMIRSMLPYEEGYISETPQSRLIEEIFKAVATPNPALRQWAGFVMYLMKQIDTHSSKQKEVDEIAGHLYVTLTEYGYGDVVRS